MLSYLAGRPIAGIRPVTPELLTRLGETLARLDLAWADFSHPSARRELKWDLVRAGWIRDHLDAVHDPGRRSLVEKVLARYDDEVVPALPRLRRSVVYADANEHNVLVSVEPGKPPRLAGLIDFGDMIETVTVSEAAVAAAYAAFGTADPLAPSVLSSPATIASCRSPKRSSPFWTPSSGCAWRSASSTPPAGPRPNPAIPILSSAKLRPGPPLKPSTGSRPGSPIMPIAPLAACLPAPHGPAVVRWLERSAASFSQVLPHDLRTEPVVVLDLSVGSRMLGADPANLETPRLAETISRAMKDAGAAVGVGRYDEARAIYTTGAFAAGGNATVERNPLAAGRTVHLGIDLSVPPGSAVRAPLDGTVHTVAENAAPKDYGPLVILRHEIPSGEEFFTLYGHLDPDSVAGLEARKGAQGGRAVRGRGRPAPERRLVASRPRPDHPRPPRPRQGFPRRGRGRPALALVRPLP